MNKGVSLTHVFADVGRNCLDSWSDNLNRMAIEIEKKYRIDEDRMAVVTERLIQLDAAYLGETLEENLLHRGGVLDGRNAVLRLRKTGERAVLTYKERVATADAFKRQIEHETEVSSVEATEEIIESLGFQLAVVYEKRRRTWSLGDVEIVLDELPFGLYMEIEGEENAIEKTEKLLDIADLTVEPLGYPRLTLKYGTQNGDVIEARFPAQQ